jgi:hypothetical protein
VKHIAVFDWKAVTGAHRKQTDPCEEQMLCHPKLAVEQIRRHKAHRNKRRVIRIHNTREDNLLKSIVEVTSQAFNFMSNVHGIVRARVKWLIAAEIWHLFAVIDPKEWIDFAFENY